MSASATQGGHNNQTELHGVAYVLLYARLP